MLVHLFVIYLAELLLMEASACLGTHQFLLLSVIFSVHIGNMQLQVYNSKNNSKISDKVTYLLTHKQPVKVENFTKINMKRVNPEGCLRD